MGERQHPYPRHQASTRFLRVPVVDWPSVRAGIKTEFRTRPRQGSRLLSVTLPSPVVAYSNARPEIATKLMVLTHRDYAPLFGIAEDPEALARENCETYDAFRTYWRARNKGLYVPLQKVWVWRVRPWAFGDDEAMGLRLLGDLYGEHL